MPRGIQSQNPLRVIAITKLTEDDGFRLANLSELTGHPKAVLVRDAILHYLTTYEQLAKSKAAGRGESNLRLIAFLQLIKKGDSARK